jgi:hypothetical protein
MGDLLGGRPESADCYVGGKVDYGKVQTTERFRLGIQRLRNAWTKMLIVCLMCSEGKPQECHRSKLIGRVLDSQGITVRHIDADGILATQQQIVDIVLGGQESLFGETFVSRKSYPPGQNAAG